jgi:GNAT superfamily N-acetyltransferase
MELKIRPLENSDLNEIANLEQFLWGGKTEDRLLKLKWKYLDIPSKELFGAVAVMDGKIVGFRGLVLSKWVADNEVLKVVHYTDAVVHPEYRGKNILSNLNKYIEEVFRKDFDIIMVFFPNKTSGHIYKKGGLKTFMTVHFFIRKLIFPSNFFHNSYKMIEDPSEIYDLIKSTKNKKIIFDFSEQYIQWKIKEPFKIVVAIKSKFSDNHFAIVEIKKLGLEILYLPENFIPESLKLVEGFAKSNLKFYINFPASYPLALVHDSVFKKRSYYSFSFLNFISKRFYVQKEILMGGFKSEETLEEEKIDKLKDPFNWEYQHLIYV